MIKKNKRKIIKNKIYLLNNNFYFLLQINNFFKNNNNISNLKRAKLFHFHLKSKKNNICFFSGKKKSFNSYLKINRSVANSFLRFNYFPNLKNFGQ